MRKIILAGVLASVAFTASAQDAASPIGKWKTLDDKSGKPMTITEVYMAKNGTLAARLSNSCSVSPLASTVLL